MQTYIGNSYSNAVIGKWHLSRTESHPTDLGVDYYAGLLSGAAQSFTNWKAAQTKPWFLWLAYTAPHTPFHLPADSLHSQGMLPIDAASIAANPLPYYMAMLEAMDHEMGRFLNSISQVKKTIQLLFLLEITELLMRWCSNLLVREQRELFTQVESIPL